MLLIIIQLQLYQKVVKEIINIESEVLEAEVLMKKKSRDSNDSK